MTRAAFDFDLNSRALSGYALPDDSGNVTLTFVSRPFHASAYSISGMSPNEARSIGRALLEAADTADGLDANAVRTVERFAVVRKIEAAGGAEYAPAHEGAFAATRDAAERESRENAGYVVARGVIEEAGR